MEQFRLILAVVLSILVFLIWDAFFVPKTPVPPPDRPTPIDQPIDRGEPGGQPLPDQKNGWTKDLQEVREKTQEQQPEASGLPEGAAPLIPEPTPLPEAASVMIETPLYRAELTERGAAIKRFALKEYKESNLPGAPQKELVSEKNAYGLLGVDLAGAGLPDMETGRYTTASAGKHFRIKESSQAVVFTRTYENGVIVEKQYTFFPDSYLIKLTVTIDNRTPDPLTGNLSVVLSKRFSGEGGRFVFEGPSAFGNQHLTEVKLNKIEETNTVTGPFDWVAIQSRYFMAAVVPDELLTQSPAAENAVMRLAALSPTAGRDKSMLVLARYVGETATVAPNAIQRGSFKVFVGPKSIPILNTAGHNLNKAVNFGWFDIVARPCLWLMNYIHRFIPNYGVAIIIVTLIIKLIFWPLGNKSYKSMGEMKKLQPLMAEIREKYKDDKKKMNEEMMGLYKTYKINPLGGCLPMIVQIPVFIAFYRMLYQSIELRHAPFMLWINDLSAPERLFSFDVAIPFMHPPAGIPVMTIIMGATMFLQQKLQPAPGDPTQAKIMMFMPIMLTFIFINFPSGLVLYFIVNNLISIAQQYYITNKTT